MEVTGSWKGWTSAVDQRHSQGPVPWSATRRLSYCRVRNTQALALCLFVCLFPPFSVRYCFLQPSSSSVSGLTGKKEEKEHIVGSRNSVLFSSAVWWVCRLTLDVFGESVNNDARKIGHNRRGNERKQGHIATHTHTHTKQNNLRRWLWTQPHGLVTITNSKRN